MGTPLPHRMCLMGTPLPHRMCVGPFFALSFSTVLLAALGILVLLRFPVV